MLVYFIWKLFFASNLNNIGDKCVKNSILLAFREEALCRITLYHQDTKVLVQNIMWRGIPRYSGVLSCWCRRGTWPSWNTKLARVGVQLWQGKHIRQVRSCDGPVWTKPELLPSGARWDPHGDWIQTSSQATREKRKVQPLPEAGNFANEWIMKQTANGQVLDPSTTATKPMSGWGGHNKGNQANKGRSNNGIICYNCSLPRHKAQDCQAQKSITIQEIAKEENRSSKLLFRGLGPHGPRGGGRGGKNNPDSWGPPTIKWRGPHQANWRSTWAIKGDRYPS